MARVLALLTTLFLVHAACAQGVQLDIERIDVVHGRPMVAPVRVDSKRTAERGVDLRLDDTRVVHALLVWIAPVQGAAPHAPPWVPEAPRFRAYTGLDGWRAAQDGAKGRWYMMARIPVDAVGQGLWLGDDRQAVNWLPDPHRIADPRSAAWASPVPEAHQADPLVREAVAALSVSPLSAWRARLI